MVSVVTTRENLTLDFYSVDCFSVSLTSSSCMHKHSHVFGKTKLFIFTIKIVGGDSRCFSLYLSTSVFEIQTFV